MPFCTSDMVTNERGIAAGQMGVISHDVEKLTGRRPLAVKDLLDEYSFIWKKRIKSLWEL